MSLLRDILLGVDKDLLEEDRLEIGARGDQTILLAQVHCLPSTLELFTQLTRPDVGIRPSRTIIVPKAYSTIPWVVDRLRGDGFNIVEYHKAFRPGHYDTAAHEAIKRGCVAALRLCRVLSRGGQRVLMILADDGGLLTETMWKLSHPRNRDKLSVYGMESAVFDKVDIISVQQTASGMRRDPDATKLTKIDISRSAAKRHFEAKIIAQGVIKKVRALKLLRNVRTAGIVGGGPLGAALARDLLARHLKVFLYDKAKINYPKETVACSSLKFLMREAEVIFGCTGQNFLRINQMDQIRAKKPVHFISCSSRDVEFKDLLQYGERVEDQPFSAIKVTLSDGQTHQVENGGFPINFDRENEQEGPEEIALTRALVFTGVLQAMHLKKTRGYDDALMLAPRAQQHIVESWMAYTGGNAEQFGVSAEDFGNLDWWRSNSGGWIAADPAPYAPILRPIPSEPQGEIPQHSFPRSI